MFAHFLYLNSSDTNSSDTSTLLFTFLPYSLGGTPVYGSIVLKNRNPTINFHPLHRSFHRDPTPAVHEYERFPSRLHDLMFRQRLRPTVVAVAVAATATSVSRGSTYPTRILQPTSMPRHLSSTARSLWKHVFVTE